MGNLYRVLSHDGSFVDGVRVWKQFIMASTGITFRMSTGDPSLLTTMGFYQCYNESNTTELEYDFYYIGLVCIHRHCIEAATKSKENT